MLTANPLRDQVAAVSCGICARARRCSTSTMPRISKAEADANFVLTGSGGIVEVQGTAEGEPFSEDAVRCRCSCSPAQGIGELVALQRLAIAWRWRAAYAGRRLVVATHNRGKVREIARAARALRRRERLGRRARPARARGDRRDASRTTRRSRRWPRRAASGLPALADDFGPRGRGARRRARRLIRRWAGPTRDFMLGMQRVQDELEARGAAEPRRATFTCALVAGARPDGRTPCSTARSTAARLAAARRRAVSATIRSSSPEGETRTFGEMDPSAKTPSAIARALSELCWRPLTMTNAPLGVYVHWPFCIEVPLLRLQLPCPRGGDRPGALARRLSEGARPSRRATPGRSVVRRSSSAAARRR